MTVDLAFTPSGHITVDQSESDRAGGDEEPRYRREECVSVRANWRFGDAVTGRNESHLSAVYSLKSDVGKARNEWFTTLACAFAIALTQPPNG